MYPDGRHLFFWGDERRTLAEVSRFSARDAEAFPKYEAYLHRLARVVESLLLVTPPELPPKRPGDFIDYLKLLAKFRGLGAREITGLVKIFTQSAADFLDEWFESPEIKVTLATDGVIGANGGPRSAGTAYILMHHCMGGVGGKRGLWGFVQGGMGAVSEAIAASARSHGAETRTHATVSQILVRDGRATGVVLADGEEIQAKVVASNLDPKRTFLRLLEAKELSAEFRGAVERFRVEVHVAQDEFRRWRGCRISSALPGAAGAAAWRDDAHLSLDRLCRAGVG